MSDIKKLGKPEDYTPDIAKQICDMIEAGMTLTAICQLDGMPHISVIYDWQDRHPGFAESYARARKRQADTYADMVMNEAFNSHDAQIGRLRIDALKWTASKLAPKKYGDKVEIETHSQNNFKVTFDVPDRETLSAPIIDVIPQLTDSASEDTND